MPVEQAIRGGVQDRRGVQGWVPQMRRQSCRSNRQLPPFPCSEAHQLVYGGHTRGKVVLRVQAE